MDISRLLFLSLLPFAGSSFAASSDLLTRINQYRADPARCEGSMQTPADPLRADEKLQQIEINSETDLQNALREVGYQAGEVQVVSMTGPGSERSAMSALKSRFCEVVLDPQFADIGITRNNRTWQIVLARPLVDNEMGSWRQAGRDILAHANEARSEARYCGEQHYEAASALQWNSDLARAAHAHSRQMASQNFFSHQGLDGDSVSDRVEQAGYRWQIVGENLAAGSGSPAQAVQGWIDSPGHCANLMNPRFTEMGAAYVVDSASDAYIYWTQVLATPR